jgi:hypothetical protein
VPALRAEQTSIDVGGAYWHGTPPSLEEGGRVIFAPVPAWMEGLGTGGYRAFDRHGRRNFLRILGNMPGRRDAGRIWQTCLIEFILAYGLRQLISDRRVWVQDSPLGIIIYHDHVDDSRLTTTAAGVLTHFHRAWALRFGESLALAERSEDFTGLRHHPTEHDTIAVSCEGVIKRLGALIAPWPLPPHVTCGSSMSATALRALRDSPLATDPVDLTHLIPMRRILGCVGFIVVTVRCDAYFAYCVLSRYVNDRRMAALVQRLVLRLAHYIVATIHLHLHLAPPERIRRGDGSYGLDLFQCYTDSSHGNAEGGLGYAGFVIMTRGPGGALGWKVMLPPNGFDSTAAAELHATTLSLKYTVAIRTLQSELELDVATTEPTMIYTDAQAVTDGCSMERTTRATRWLAAKYAMVRLGTACRAIALGQVSSEDQIADIVTKPLVRMRF